MSTIPFSYYLYHKPTGQHYYGIRFARHCNPSQLWTTYFSSSIIVKKLISDFGVESFNYEIRKIFNSGVDALKWEHTVLRRLNAAARPNWINRHNGGKKFRAPQEHSAFTKETLRKKISGIKRSAETKEKQSASAVKREAKRRADGWKMPADSVLRRAAAQRNIPRSPDMIAKMSATKTGTKRQYLPDGTFIMVKSQDAQ
jgi:hypothetical protein